jgi:hypothetical protein
MINTLRYSNLAEVHLGDRVEVKSFFFFKDLGTVVYIPGVSPFHPEMENNGIEYLGVKLDGKSFAAATIHPKSKIVLNTKFLKRGFPNHADGLKYDQQIFDQ